jgi:tellurite resistance protein
MADDSDNPGCLGVIGIGVIIFSLVSFSNGSGIGGFLLLLGGIVLVVMGYSNSGTATPVSQTSNQTLPSASSSVPSAANQRQSTLQLMVLTKAEKTGGIPVNFLKFHTKGIFSNHQRIARPCFEFRLVDVTDTAVSEGAPVLCVIDDLQDEHSTEFRFRQILPQALDAGSGSFDWVELCSVPKELLVFPNKGNRSIKATLKVTDVGNGRLIATADTIWTTSVDGLGYLEMEDEESAAQAASLQLAMCIAAADGRVDDDEVAVIKEWGERTVNALPTARQPERRSILNNALSYATREIRANRMPMLESESIHLLNEKDEARFLYDAYELCLQVLKADGEAHPKEMAQLTRLGKKLGLNETKMRILTDRYLANVQFAPVEDESEDDDILGITNDMSKDEIRKHLNKLYQKHQARTQHDNPDVIAKSKEWLDRIARARVRHLG